MVSAFPIGIGETYELPAFEMKVIYHGIFNPPVLPRGMLNDTVS